MVLENLSKDELELMNYKDIVFEYMKSEKRSFTFMELFNKLCTLLDLDSEDSELFGEVFGLLTDDKRFLNISPGVYDLRQRAKFNFSNNIDDNEDEDIDFQVFEDEEEPEEYADDNEDKTNNDDVEEDELKDLNIITDEDEDE
ncbi:MAG: hypothetical protein ACK5HL_03980 [Bacilli bacterium]